MAAVPDRPLDQASISECHAALSKMLEKYAWAIVRDWGLAADVVQASFVALSRFGGDVEPEARRSWLFKVTHREALRIRERQKPYSQETHESTAAIFEKHAIYEVTPLAKLADREAVERLTKQIGELSREQQEVLRLRFFENMTFAEIASSMHIPIGTALSRMRLALERLRAMSKESED